MSSREEDYVHWISLAILCYVKTPEEMVFSAQVPSDAVCHPERGEGSEEPPTARTHHALAWQAASSRRARAVPREASSRCRDDHDRPLHPVLLPVSSPRSNSCTACPRVDRR